MSLALLILWTGCGPVDTPADTPADSDTWFDDTGPEPQDSDPGEAIFRRVQEDLFDDKCVGCHWGNPGNPGSASGDLALDVGAWTTLTTDLSTWGEPYVVAGDPEASVIFQKVMDTQPGARGTVMPPYGSLEQAQVDLLEGWIEAGAAPP